MVALVVDMKEDLAMLFGDDDFSDDDFEGFTDDEEVWEVNKEWLMAPVTPPLMPDIPLPSTYEVGGPSTVAVEGHSFTLPTPGFPMPSDVEVADGIAIKEIIPRAFAVEGQVQAIMSRMVQVVGKIEQRDMQIQQLQTMVTEMSSREGTLMQCILRMDRRLADLKRRLLGPQTIDESVGGKLRDRNTKESWALLEDLALYDNENLNDLRDFAKPIKAISLPQDVLSTSDRRLIELENQVQCLMEAHPALSQPTQVNKITSSCEICKVPTTLSIAWKVPNKPLLNMHPCVPIKREASGTLLNPSKTILVTPTIHHGKVTNTLEFVYTKEDDGDVMFIEIIKKNDDPKTRGLEVDYFDMFPTQSELAYHKYLIHVHVEKSYIDLNSFLNIMTQMMYNWIMRRKLDPSSIIDPRLSQVVLGKPFIETSNMTHDPPEGVVTFTNRTDEVAYKMPHKIEHYNSLSDLEKEHTKLVYLRNEEDKRKGLEYVMSKILGFYKECL
nr:MAK10-like protein [Tanacetum cinerariifolium]